MVKCEHKRILCLLVISFLVCFTFQPCASASDVPFASYINPEPMLRAMYTSWTYTDISISSSGSAGLIGQITGISGVTTRVAIYLYLEIYANNTWSVVASESQTFSSILDLSCRSSPFHPVIPIASGLLTMLLAAAHQESGSFCMCLLLTMERGCITIGLNNYMR